MQSTLKTRVQLELLKKLREKKNPLQKGFTLVELMIVVAIVGILSAVALPNFLQARNAAAAGAAIGEALGIAKECAVFVASGGVGAAPTAGAGAITCATSGTSKIESATWTAGPAGLKCLSTTLATTATKVTISIGTNGAMTCA